MCKPKCLKSANFFQRFAIENMDSGPWKSWSRNYVQVLENYRWWMNPVDTGRKLNVQKTFRRSLGRLLNVLCTFNLLPVSTEKEFIFSCKSSILEFHSKFFSFTGKFSKPLVIFWTDCFEEQLLLEKVYKCMRRCLLHSIWPKRRNGFHVLLA